MAEVLKKFGRYFLLDLLAQGGMAEIYRARQASSDGAGRILVIKRIQGGYGANAEFLQMFKSETKVMLGFNHPNIVQLYDFGEEHNQPFIAMEWVDGRNLRQFMSRFGELKQTFPVELAAYIIEQSACGLQYAHSFKDKITGRSLNLVHRDVSPQNILISYEGNIKVIDFGIAKAAVNSESTRAGIIKGKPSYLSPEQISGEALDGRSDIFALGTVLWELLTGKKLFAGENDLAVLKLIESCTTHVKPPSTINPKVPKELDYVVLRALAKQREKRYQTAEEMQRALHKFLYGFAPDFNPSDLSYYAKDLFKNEIVDDRKQIQKLNEKVEQLLTLEISESPALQNPVPHTKEETTVVDPRGAISSGSREYEVDKDVRVELDKESGARPSPRFGSAKEFPAPKPTKPMGSAPAPIPVPVPRQRGTAAQGGKRPFNAKTIWISVAALVAVVFFGPDLGIRIPVVSDVVSDWLGGGEARLVLQGDMKDVNVLVNGQSVARSLPATVKGIPVGTPFHVAVTGTNLNFEQDVTLKKSEKKVIQVPASAFGTGRALAAVDPGKPSIALRLNITPGGGDTHIEINGTPVNPDNPVVQVPLDSPLEITAERQGFHPLHREFAIESSQVVGLKEWLMDVPLEPDKFGFLTLHTTPSAEASIQLGGKPWVRRTPIDDEKLPIGTYNIRLVNDVLGMEKTITVSVREGKVTTVEEELEIKN